MNKKIIFSDLDGTLIGENGKIPVSARNACMRALEKGHLLYIATGRPRCEIDDEILTAINFTGIISAGGGQIDVEGSTIFKAAFSTRVLSHIIEFFDRYKTGCIFERPDSILVSKPVFEYFKLFQEHSGRVPEFYTKFLNLIKGDLDASHTDVAKVVFCDNGNLSVADVKREFAEECEVFYGGIPIFGRNNGELSPIGINKGAALDMVLRHYGIPKEDSIAIGDSDNDTAMYQYCGYGIAMGNAQESLKEAAHYVTDTLEQDGFMKALEHYGLL